MAAIVRLERTFWISVIAAGLLLVLLVLAVPLVCRRPPAPPPPVAAEADDENAADTPDLAVVTTRAGEVHLKRALFCLDISPKRRPLLAKLAFSRRVDYIYCYSVLTAPKEGVTILHRWIVEGQPVFERRLRVQGKNCRVWSRRHLMLKNPGRGRVEILVEEGNMLGAAVFTLL